MSSDRIKRITVEEAKCGGRPCIRGHRIRVTDVLELLANGASFDEILSDYAFLEDNLAGPVIEWWLHVPTAYWFIAERDTRSDAILRTWTVAAFRAEGRL